MDNLKIAEALKAMVKATNEIKELKKSIKEMEKVETEDYIGLKKTIKEMSAQAKEIKEKYEKELLSDLEYCTLKDLKTKKEEEKALAAQSVAELLYSDMPGKLLKLPNIETDEGILTAHVAQGLKLYVNGKEQK